MEKEALIIDNCATEAIGRDGEPDFAPVLEWLQSDEARRLASRRLANSGFGGWSDLADDVLADAAVAVIRRSQSTKPFEVENPAAYGTRIVQNAIKGLSRGDLVRLDELDEEPAEPERVVDPELADDLRVLLEDTTAPRWLCSAVLAYVCLAMFPDTVPAGAPKPRAGARPDQALAWPALWFAGEQDLFPDGHSDPHRRKRARRISRVQEHLAEVASRHRADREFGDG